LTPWSTSQELVLGRTSETASIEDLGCCPSSTGAATSASISAWHNIKKTN